MNYFIELLTEIIPAKQDRERFMLALGYAIVSVSADKEIQKTDEP